jgi:hypothetical protein
MPRLLDILFAELLLASIISRLIYWIFQVNWCHFCRFFAIEILKTTTMPHFEILHYDNALSVDGQQGILNTS